MEVSEVLLQGSSWVSLSAALLVLLLLYLLLHSASSSPVTRKEPPGPRPLPLLGNLLQLDHQRPFRTFMEWSKKYGSVFTVYMGPKKVVALVGYQTVKEALVTFGEEFGDREVFLITEEANQGHGILWSNGDSWREMRRFALKNLRDFGNKESENRILDEFSHLFEELKKHQGKFVNVACLLNYVVANVICSMVFGSRFHYDDSEFTSAVERVQVQDRLLVSPSIQIYNVLPWFCRWISNRREYHKIGEDNTRFYLQQFRRLKESLSPQTCRGMVDTFLLQKENLERSGVTESHFHEQNLCRSALHLFFAGTNTTGLTLRYGVMLMVKNPEAQDQVQEELRRVVGDRRVMMQDRKNLPFTNAVVHETHRLVNIAPLGLPRKTRQDVTFQGYFIRKGTIVYPVLHSVLFDEKQWEEPHSFHPAHFLDQHGNFVKRDAFMPFSAGRRVCVGEGLARMETFLFFSNLMQSFRFSAAPGVSLEKVNENELHVTIQSAA